MKIEVCENPEKMQQLSNDLELLLKKELVSLKGGTEVSCACCCSILFGGAARNDKQE